MQFLNVFPSCVFVFVCMFFTIHVVHNISYLNLTLTLCVE